jgi:hypothetical protein
MYIHTYAKDQVFFIFLIENLAIFLKIKKEKSVEFTLTHQKKKNQIIIIIPNFLPFLAKKKTLCKGYNDLEKG